MLAIWTSRIVKTPSSKTVTTRFSPEAENPYELSLPLLSGSLSWRIRARLTNVNFPEDTFIAFNVLFDIYFASASEVSALRLCSDVRPK